MHEHVPPEHVPKVARRTTPARHQAERAARQTEHGEALRGELSKMGRLVATCLLRPTVPFPFTMAPAPPPPAAPAPPQAAWLAALCRLGRPDDSAEIRRTKDAGRSERPSTPANVPGRDGVGRAVLPPPTDLVPQPLTPASAGLQRGGSYAIDGVRGPRLAERRLGA